MNDTDELFSHVRDSFGQVRMNEPVERITGRGRSLRRRRTTVSLAATTLCAAAAVTTLVVTLSPGDPDRPGGPTHVRLAAWSVDSGPQDTVTVTVRTPNNPAELTEALSDAGVNAEVAFFGPGRRARCVDPDAGRPELDKVVGSPPVRTEDGATVLTIRRDAMPPDTVLHFVIFQTAKGNATAGASSVWLLPGGAKACVAIP